MHNPFDKDQIDAIRDFLIKRKESIAVAESAAAGLLQSAIASASNAMQFFQGGITAYNIGQKTKHLQIDPIEGIECNCVSERVAETMALSACKLFNSQWGISITGYSTPVPESNNQTYCFYAIVHDGQTIIKHRIEGTEKDAFRVQIDYVTKLIESFAAYVNKQK